MDTHWVLQFLQREVQTSHTVTLSHCGLPLHLTHRANLLASVVDHSDLRVWKVPDTCLQREPERTRFDSRPEDVGILLFQLQ